MNKDKTLDWKLVYYQKNFNDVRTQQRAYYTENATRKKFVYFQLLYVIYNFQYVSLTDKIDIVIEQNGECFSDIDFARDRNRKYCQVNCKSKKAKRRKYYAENTDKFCKMKSLL